MTFQMYCGILLPMGRVTDICKMCKFLSMIGMHYILIAKTKDRTDYDPAFRKIY